MLPSEVFLNNGGRFIDVDSGGKGGLIVYIGGGNLSWFWGKCKLMCGEVFGSIGLMVGVEDVTGIVFGTF